MRNRIAAWMGFGTVQVWHSYGGAGAVIYRGAHIVCAFCDLLLRAQHLDTGAHSSSHIYKQNANYTINRLTFTIRICNRLTYISLIMQKKMGYDQVSCKYKE